MPTARPATTSVAKPASIRGAGKAATSRATAGAARSPPMKAKRQPISPARAESRPPRMPLTPATRPFRSTSIAAATPMRSPPASDAQGVKWAQSTVMSFPSVLQYTNMRVLVIAAAALLAHAASAQSPPTHQHSFGDAEKWSHVFDDPERDAWQKPHAVLQALALKPDAVVADLGAGT